MASGSDTARFDGSSFAGRERLVETRSPIEETIDQIVRIEQRDSLAMSFSDRIADRITALSGSMLFVWLHVAWFAA